MTTAGKAASWIGRVLTTLLCIWMIVLPLGFLIFAPDIPKKGMADYGYPAETVVPLNIMCMIFAVLFAIPRTAVLGGLLLTAYLGGAAATHVRLEQYALIAMPIAFGLIVWTALLLREPKLRRLLPILR